MFTDSIHFKQLLLGDRDKFLRAFIEHLCTYSLRRVLTVNVLEDVQMTTRRHFFRSAAAGSMLFQSIMNRLLADAGDPLAVPEPHFPTKAKNVIL